MDNKANRLVTTGLLLAFFAVIAVAAGRQTPTTSSNVLVTNSISQPLPVKITASTSAPIKVTDAAHGKDGLALHQTIDIGANTANGLVQFNSIPGERFVIQSIYIAVEGPVADALTGAKLSIQYNNSSLTTVAFGTAQVYDAGGQSDSALNFQGPFYLDPGQTLYFSVFRSGADEEFGHVSLTGYRVAYP